MKTARPDVRERFRQVVQRAIAKVDRELDEHLERLRPSRRRPQKARLWGVGRRPTR